MKTFFKYLIRTLLVLILILLIFLFYAYYRIQIDEPQVKQDEAFNLKRTLVNDSLTVSGNDWIKLNDKGLYEMYLSGSPLELGVKHGLLAKELVAYQEEAFVAEIRKKVPSESYLNFLKYFIGWFNRDMNDYVPLENRLEIYGVSQFTDDKYDFIAPKYQRILNYHGAHDIGHTLQNMNLVACTAFGAWGDKSEDQSLILGRNFDFFVGTQFAEKKILAFVKPDSGYAFASITWGGMTGILSGMNEKGLSVTLNSAKSDMPLSSKTPVSIVARQILQHCSTIEEAYQKAQSFETFVSESFMIGSAQDHRAAVIEKTPEETALYQVESNSIILSNHFQSDAFKDTPLNQENISESASMYRYQRTEELLSRYPTLNPPTVAEVLRNQQGLNDQNIGLCNEKALNQLIAHHSVIFKPEQLQMWISTNDFQLGEYICYDLEKVFSKMISPKTEIRIDSLTIEEDPFMHSEAYQNAQFYRQGVDKIRLAIEQKQTLNETYLQKFVASNPKFYHVYKMVGDYYAAFGLTDKALESYQKAMTCEFPRLVDKTDVESRMQKLSEK